MRMRNLLTFILALCVFIAPTQAGRRNISDIPRATRGYLALTFDDGPTTNETVKILDELRKWPSAKVTFYVNGAMFNSQTIPVLQRMIAEGHDVDNHGFNHLSHGNSHPDSRLNGVPTVLSTTAQARDNIQRNSQAIYDATGFWPFSFRAPFFEWGAQLRGLDSILNMPFVHANYDTKDYSNQGNPQGMASGVISGAKDGTIILMHDAPAGIRQGTVNSLQLFIPQLIAQGYVFVTVRELFAIKQAQPERFQSPFDTHNPNASVPINLESGGRRWNHQDFWPNHPTWWTLDFWSCSTPPWQRGNNLVCPPPVTTRYTVTFNANGGSAVNSIQQATAGASITLPTTTRTGFTFNGWRTATNCGGTLAGNAGASYTPQSNITLFACWQENGGGGQTRIVDVMGWGTDSWDIEHNGNSTVTLNVQPARVNFTLNRGNNPNPSGNDYSWAQAFVGFNAGDFVSAVSITLTYTSSRAIELILGDPALTRTGEGYMYPLAASNTPRTLTIPISDFAQPEWVSASNRRPNVLANISSVLFQATVAGQSTEVIITELKFNHTGGGSVAISDGIGGVRARAVSNAISVTGISAGKLGLSVPSSGEYTVSFYNIDGRMISQTKTQLVQGVNTLPVGNLAKGVTLVRIQGANAQLVKRVVVK